MLIDVYGLQTSSGGGNLLPSVGPAIAGAIDAILEPYLDLTTITKVSWMVDDCLDLTLMTMLQCLVSRFNKIEVTNPVSSGSKSWTVETLMVQANVVSIGLDTFRKRYLKGL